MGEVFRPFALLSCVILAIDPGKASGWAVFVCGQCVASGVAKSHETRTLAIDLALVEAERHKLPFVVAAEKWTAGGWASHTAMMGLGASWGDWRTALELAEVPKARVVRVHPQTWRARVLGAPRAAKSDQLKKLAVVHASREVGHTPETDEADAICIGVWATRAPEVAAKMPKPRARKSKSR